MRVRWRLTKARHAAISFEVVEWSELLRSVTSVWLGAAAAAFKSDSAPAGVSEREKCLVLYLSRMICFLRLLLLLSLLLLLAGPAVFRGRLRAFGKCTNGVAFSKGRPNLAGVRLIL